MKKSKDRILNPCIKGCSVKVFRDNLCQKCWYIKQRGHDGCIIKGCTNKHDSHGYCSKHATQIKKHGKILERTKYDPNKFLRHNTKPIGAIVLYNRQGDEIGRAIIDSEDLPKVKKYKWCLNGDGYAVSRDNNTNTFLHRFVMGLDKTDKRRVDHKNRKPLICKKSNLRICTQAKNVRNKKVQSNNKLGIKGVCYNSKLKKPYVVQLSVDKEQVYRKCFYDPLNAAKAYNRAAKKYHGKYAKLNDLKEVKQIIKEHSLVTSEDRESRVLNPCTIKNCGKKVFREDLCRKHYYKTLPPKICSFKGCDKIVKAKGLCVGHWTQQSRGYKLKPLKI